MVWARSTTCGATGSTGKRREGIFQAFGSWTIKVGLAIGGGAAGYVLTFTGFDQA